MKTIATDKKVLIAGLGATGLSCARFLSKLGRPFMVMDSRDEPPGKEELLEQFPDAQVWFGSWDQSVLNNVDEILLSPGIAKASEPFVEAAGFGVKIRGDIDLFTEFAKAPVVAITGSNGKSTVTTLLGDMAKANGTRVAVGGNLGVPALDLLDDAVELYVLELSSFQLETVGNLSADAVTLLNISEDHMDRYPDKLSYLRAKQRIFMGAKTVVVNDDETLSFPLVSQEMSLVHFGTNSQDLNKFALAGVGQDAYLVRGFDELISVKELALQGRHNYSNALAALALGASVGLRMDAMLSTLKTYRGLPHRCEFVRDHDGVRYINDSKGTNTGAASVAIESLGESNSGQIIWIAGGEGKGADMSVLQAPVRKYVKSAVLIGTDAKLIAKEIEGAANILFASDMKEAVHIAQGQASEGDVVLLSPACASFDMFANFEARGEAFVEQVNAL